MGMTITEKILAAHAGKAAVEPGEFIIARPDMVMGNDLSTAGAIGVLKEMGARKVFDPKKVAIVFDHIVPAKDIQAADLLKGVRQWVREQGIPHFYDEGRQGIAHIIMPEQGLALPGDLIIGGDSHSCTYGAVGAFSAGVGHTDLAGVLALGEVWLKVPASIKFTYHGRLGPWIMGKDLILATIGKIRIDGALYQAMEFKGPAIASLGISERLTMCNMAIEAGGKSGIIAPDEVTLAYVRERAKRPWTVYQSDPDARYAALHDFDVTGMRPQVAKPFSPDNVVDLEPVAEGRASGGVRRRGRRHLDADLRGLLRRSYGGSGGGRGVPLDVQSQLRRADGPPHRPVLPVEPRRGGRLRDQGVYRRPRRSLVMTGAEC